MRRLRKYKISGKDRQKNQGPELPSQSPALNVPIQSQAQNVDLGDSGGYGSASEETFRPGPFQPANLERTCTERLDGPEVYERTLPETVDGNYAGQRRPLASMERADQPRSEEDLGKNPTAELGILDELLTQNEALFNRCAHLEEQLRQQDDEHKEALRGRDEKIGELQQKAIQDEVDLRSWKRSHNEEQSLRQKLEGDMERQEENHKREVGRFNALKIGYEQQLLVKDMECKELNNQKAKENLMFKGFNRLLIRDADDFQPKPDSHFRTRFEVLQRKVQLLAKKAKCELHVDKETLGAKFGQALFARAVEDHHLKLVLENAFWMILCEKIFLTPFRVFGEHGNSLFITWCKFFSKNQIKEPSAFALFPLDSRSEKWRSVAFEVLQKAVTAEGRSRSADDFIVNSYERNRTSVSKAFRAAFSQVSPEEMGTVPEDIAEVACSLALDCGTERCRVQLFAPQEGELVSREDRRFIQDRNEGSNPNITKGVVKLVVSPGLMKLGDGYDRSLSTEPVRLHPADVYCSVSGGCEGE